MVSVSPPSCQGLVVSCAGAGGGRHAAQARDGLAPSECRPCNVSPRAPRGPVSWFHGRAATGKASALCSSLVACSNVERSVYFEYQPYQPYMAVGVKVDLTSRCNPEGERDREGPSWPIPR